MERRNLTEAQKRYLIGKQYSSEKASHGAADGFRGNQFTASPPKGDLPKLNPTWKKVAERNHVGKKYVYNAGRYANGVDAADEVAPGIQQDILCGRIAPTAKDVSEVATAEPEERPEKVRRLRMSKEELKRMREIGESLQTARKVTEEIMLVSVSALVDTMRCIGVTILVTLTNLANMERMSIMWRWAFRYGSTLSDKVLSSISPWRMITPDCKAD